METKAKRIAARILLGIGLNFAGTSLFARETRKALNSPTPTYPEAARQSRLRGVVKAKVAPASGVNVLFDFHP